MCYAAKTQTCNEIMTVHIYSIRQKSEEITFNGKCFKKCVWVLSFLTDTWDSTLKCRSTLTVRMCSVWLVYMITALHRTIDCTVCQREAGERYCMPLVSVGIGAPPSGHKAASTEISELCLTKCSIKQTIHNWTNNIINNNMTKNILETFKTAVF